MPLEGDKATIIDAIVLATKLRGREWLVAEILRFTDALMAGKARVKSLSLAGSSTTGDYEITTGEAIEISKAALDQYDGEKSGSGDAAGGCIIIPRFGSCGIPY
jgi:hypothetical protein